MVVIKKKTSKTSLAQILSALKKLIELLSNQDEEQAIADLKTAQEALTKYSSATKEYKEALEFILAAFEREEGLMDYTYSRKKAEAEWGEAEELYMASTEVLSLTKRLLKSIP